VDEGGSPKEESPPELPFVSTPPPTLSLVPKEHPLKAYVEAWNRGRANTKISEADPPGRNALERDRRWLKLLERYPDPADWEWCARALATSTHHCGANGWGPASAGWIVENKAKLEEWVRKGRGLRAGTWEAPKPPTRPAGRSLDAAMAWDHVLALARRGAFAPGKASPGVDARTTAALRACRGGLAVAKADLEELGRLKRTFTEVYDTWRSTG